MTHPEIMSTVKVTGESVLAHGDKPALRFEGYPFDVGIAKADVTEVGGKAVVEGQVLGTVTEKWGVVVRVLFKGAHTFVDIPIQAVSQ